MNELDQLLKDTAERLFGDLCDRTQIEQSEKGQWPDSLWDAIEAAGLTDARDPEGDGTTLLPLTTLAVIVRALGEFAVPLPVAETFLAQRYLVLAGMDVPHGPLSVAPYSKDLELKKRDGNWYLSGQLKRVPWGRNVSSIVFEVDHENGSALVCLKGVQPARLGTNLANEPRDDFVLSDQLVTADCVTLLNQPQRHLVREGMLLRTLQITGALGRSLGMTVQYSMERVQFGRAIAKFQAVQHQVATMATHAAAAAAAAEAAVNSTQERIADFEIMAAKLRASEAASVCCRIAHQVHGAMGFTHEHSLHTLTRRLMSWRDEFGSEVECGQWIGEQIHRIGGAQLWSYISTPQLHADVTQAC